MISPACALSASMISSGLCADVWILHCSRRKPAPKAQPQQHQHEPLPLDNHEEELEVAVAQVRISTEASCMHLAIACCLLACSFLAAQGSKCIPAHKQPIGAMTGLRVSAIYACHINIPVNTASMQHTSVGIFTRAHTLLHDVHPPLMLSVRPPAFRGALICVHACCHRLLILSISLMAMAWQLTCCACRAVCPSPTAQSCAPVLAVRRSAPWARHVSMLIPRHSCVWMLPLLRGSCLRTTRPSCVVNTCKTVRWFVAGIHWAASCWYAECQGNNTLWAHMSFLVPSGMQSLWTAVHSSSAGKVRSHVCHGTSFAVCTTVLQCNEFKPAHLPELDLQSSQCQHVCTGSCPHGILCCFAHSSRELRVAAAISLGRLDRTFKTQLCPHFAAGHRCPAGHL